MKKIIPALLAVCAFNSADAQTGSGAFSKDHWSIYIAPGGQNYLGDLLPRKYDAFGASYDLKPSLKLGAEYTVGRVVRVRMGYFGSKLSGDEVRDFQKIEPDESWRKKRAFSFTSPVHELSLSVIWDILGFRQAPDGVVFRSYFTPYIGAGIGYAILNPKLGDTTKAYQFALAEGQMDYYRNDLDKTPIKGTLVFPVTIGARWQFSPQGSVFAEWSRHFLSTDYLDRVSNWNTARKNDGYLNYAIGFRYNLASGSRRIKI